MALALRWEEEERVVRGRRVAMGSDGSPLVSLLALVVWAVVLGLGCRGD